MDEKLKKIVQDLVDSYPAAWTHSICAYDAYTKDGAKNFNRGSKNGDVCHAGLNYLQEPSIVVNAHRPDWYKKNPEFAKWVITDCPFSHGVLNRENDREWQNHAAVLDTELIGKGGALWVCKAMRHFVEDTHKPAIWDKLRNEGLDGLQAFIGADIIDMHGNPLLNNTHVSLFRYDTPSNLRKWYDAIRKKDKITSSDANQGGYVYYDGKTWGALGFKIERKKDGWGGFIEKQVPCEAKEFAAKLKEIFEGDPKNVK